MTGFPINPPNCPLVDERGNCRSEWYRFFTAIQQKIGGPVDPFEDIIVGVGSPANTSMLAAQEGHDLDYFPPPAPKLLTEVADGGTGVTTLPTGYLLKGNGTGPVTQSIAYDNGTRIGIGTNGPSEVLHVVGNAFASGAVIAGDVNFSMYLSGGSSGNATVQMDANDYILFDRSANTFQLFIGGSSVAQFAAGAATLQTVSLLLSGLFRTLEVGAVDSGGVGYRAVRALN